MPSWTNYRQRKQSRALSKFSPEVCRQRIAGVLRSAEETAESQGNELAVKSVVDFWRKAFLNLCELPVEVGVATLYELWQQWEDLINGEEFREIRAVLEPGQG